MSTEQSARKSLIEGVHMRCPRCEELFPVLSWRPLNEIEKYAKETAPVYKCRRNQVSITGKKGCGFLFAVSDYTPNRAQIETLPDFLTPEIETEPV
jgi:hypothetical protein